MPVITLPDGNKKVFNHPVSILEVASEIGPGLAKATIAGEVNGKLYDASDLIETDAELRIITSKDKEGVEIILYNRSAYDLWLTDNFTAPSYLRVASISESHEAFHAGRADVLASLKPKLVEEMEASDAFRIIDPPFTAIRQAVGIAKNKPEVLRFINEVISELSQNGDIAASLERHGVNKKLSLP